jgi:hypothetical protein
MVNSCILYLNDTIKQLIQIATEIKEKDDFNKGKLFGYYESISLLLSQAEAFQIMEQLDKEIQDFTSEQLLVSKY